MSRPTDRRLLAAACGLAVLVFAVCWYRHATFRSTTLDLGVYDQAVWKLAHFRSPELSMIGWNAFADHLSLVLFAFVPLYWIAATPLWLLAAQAVAFGAGLLAVRPLLDALGVNRRWQGAFLLAYVASPLLWNGAVYDFHPTVLATPFIMVGLRAALVDDRRRLMLCSLAVLVLRDDLGLVVAALALVGFSSLDPAGRRLRMLLVAGGLAWMAGAGVLATVLGSDRHWAFHYGYLGATPGEAVLHPLRTAVRLLQGVGRVDNAALVVAGFLIPLGFLPAFAPRRLALVAIPALPLLASAGEQFHSIFFHYDAYLFPFLLLAAASGLPRASARLEPLGKPLLLVAGTLAMLTVAGPFPQLITPSASRSDYARAMALIGPDDGVMATEEIGPHLSQRQKLYLFPFALAQVKPDFPLPAKAATSTPQSAAEVDAVIVGPLLHADEAIAFDAFAHSPYLAEFPIVMQVGEVTVYRRRAL